MRKKPVRMHKLPAHMAALWESTLANRPKYEFDPEKFHFVGRHRLADECWLQGCLALAGMGEGEAAAREAFHAAGRYAGLALTLPTPAYAPPGYIWAAHTFESLLQICTAFGPRDTAVSVARIPGERFRSPDIVGPPESFLIIHAFQAWLLGDDAQVAAWAAEILATPSVHPSTAASASALQALARRDEGALKAAVHDVVVTAKRQVRYLSSPARGIVCGTGIALCRMARTVGIEVEDQIYLPTRLLPTEAIR
jgi:hypothetical protein